MNARTLQADDVGEAILAWLLAHHRLEPVQAAHARKVRAALRLAMPDILVKLRMMSDGGIAEALAGVSGLRLEAVEHRTIDPTLLGMLPYALARRFRVLPLRRERGVVVLAASDPFDSRAAEQLARHFDGQVAWVVAPRSSLVRAIEAAYHFSQDASGDALDQMLSSGAAQADGARLVRAILSAAIEAGASDVHFSPAEFASMVSFRVDGVLQLRHVLPVELHARLVSYLKIEAGMDIAETRRPLDGSFTFEFLNEPCDLRISSMPTTHGENLVTRILSASGDVPPLSLLGFTPRQQEQIERLLSAPHGIVLATGPTGSGKTTTLYSALRLVSLIEKNVMTVEDPVEYKVPLIRQVSMNEKAGMTFAAAVRGFLRQDPDIMLVGEVRDGETAELAVRAAQTGHLVPATLHTNDAVGAVTRLRDLGIEPYLVSAAINGVIAQRLVRRLCPACREADPHEPRHFVARGCKRCHDSGYIGRTALAEVLVVDDELRGAIAAGASETQLRQLALQRGLESLREGGQRLLDEGIVDRRELRRVFGAEGWS